MSLIQEALRRQQEEKQAADQKDTARVPEAPTPPAENEPIVVPDTPAPAAPTARKLSLPARPPMPSDSTTEETAPEAPAPEPPLRRTPTEKKHRILLPLLGVFLVLLLLGGVAVWTVLYGLQMFSRPDEVLAPVTAETPAAPEPTEPLPDDAMALAIAEAIPADEAPDEAPDAVPDAAPDPSDPVDPADADTPDATEPVAVEPVAEIAPLPEVTPPTPPPVVDAPPPAEPTPAPEPVIWPEVHVSGVIGAGSSGSAIINGKVVGLNDTIDDLTVRDFGRGFVILEYQGETRRFSVGRPLR